MALSTATGIAPQPIPAVPPPSATGKGDDSDPMDLAAIFDLSPVATALLSPSLQIKRASRSLLDAWKLTSDECLGRDIASVLHDRGYISADDDKTRFQVALQTAVEQKSVQTLARDDIVDDLTPTTSNDQPWSIRVVPVFRADALLALVLEWTPPLMPQAEDPASSTEPAAPAIPAASRKESINIVSSRTDNARNMSQLVSKRSPNSRHLADSLPLDESLRILIQTVKDYAIFLLDVHGNIATWNTGAQLNKGYTAEEIIGKHFSIFYGPEDIANRKPWRELEDCMRDGRVVDEGWRIRKDGSRFWANVTITAVYKDGVHVGFGKVTRDLTERRAAELRLIAAYEESAKLKSDFLANMSHEIRTPMHGMLSACSLLLDTDLTPDQRETANIIDESGQVLLRVINDILDYSKLASGNFSIHTDVVGIASIITSVVRSVQTTLQPSVRLQLDLASDLPRAVQGDPLRYRQIVQNIVGNATKFTDRGHISVDTSVQSQDDETYVILTKVTDTGIGVPEQAVPNLFVPFTQVDNTTKKRFPGTGLGLSICKSLVELMGGEIGFYPNPERQGSVFWFTARFVKIKSLSQLKQDNKATAEHIRRRRTLSPIRQRLSQFEMEKNQSVEPPLERAAKEAGKSKAEMAAGAGSLRSEVRSPGGHPLREVESISPDLAPETLSSSSTPATTPTSELTPLSPPTSDENSTLTYDSIASVTTPSTRNFKDSEIPMEACAVPVESTATYTSFAPLHNQSESAAEKETINEAQAQEGELTPDASKLVSDGESETPTDEQTPDPNMSVSDSNIEAPKDRQEVPKDGQEAPKGGQEAPKDGQEAPKDGQEAPKKGQAPEANKSVSDADKEAPKDPLSTLRVRAPGKRLLVAEDNVINQRVLLGMLRMFGFDKDLVALASNGAEAVTKIRDAPAGTFDLVLMDINMPQVDGHEATAQIRQSGNTVPIIAMTAYALQGDREQCLACGMDDYVAKPVDRRVLVDKLLAWLPESGGREEKSVEGITKQ